MKIKLTLEQLTEVLQDKQVRDFVSTIYYADEDTPYKMRDCLDIKDGDSYYIISIKPKLNNLSKEER